MTSPAQVLGSGRYVWEIYDRTGRNRQFTIPKWISGSWSRERDDMSSADLTIPVDGCWVDGADAPETRVRTGYGQQLADLRTFWHTLVITRIANGRSERVWEGPLTLIEYTEEQVHIEARDVLVWVYRRVILTGYNDAYPNINTVVNRAAMLLQQELGRDDPNVLPYLRKIATPDDARESRTVAAAEKTLFQEIDDMAANSGLDFTALGRAILLFDTHNAIGQLPDLEDRWFEGGVAVTEYGMELATDMYNTSQNAGIYGEAHTNRNDYYGRIEMLASPYSESDDDLNLDLSDPVAVAAYRATLDSQAQRNLDGRYPAPVYVRIPQNARLSPSAPITIAQLVPGSWGRVTSRRTLRFSQSWQKLDSVAVTVDAQGEKVSVSFGTAPGQGADADLSLDG